jgi:hypothetical protein
VAALTKWLLLCDCPPASISIVTTKGQKTITNSLRKNGFILQEGISAAERNYRQCFDCGQSDENDVVILS